MRLIPAPGGRSVNTNSLIFKCCCTRHTGTAWKIIIHTQKVKGRWKMYLLEKSSMNYIPFSPCKKFQCRAWLPDLLKRWITSIRKHFLGETIRKASGCLRDSAQSPNQSVFFNPCTLGNTSHLDCKILLKWWLSLCWHCFNKFVFIFSKTEMSENWP